jgi:hypothetical protein
VDFGIARPTSGVGGNLTDAGIRPTPVHVARASRKTTPEPTSSAWQNYSSHGANPFDADAPASGASGDRRR